jgi:hypothetical protein
MSDAVIQLVPKGHAEIAAGFLHAVESVPTLLADLATGSVQKRAAPAYSPRFIVACTIHNT